jgi:hypothetical protein
MITSAGGHRITRQKYPAQGLFGGNVMMYESKLKKINLYRSPKVFSPEYLSLSLS